MIYSKTSLKKLSILISLWLSNTVFSAPPVGDEEMGSSSMWWASSIGCASSSHSHAAEEATVHIAVNSRIESAPTNTRQQKYSGKTALRLAVENESQYEVQTLLASGEDPLTKDHDGSNALYCAAENATRQPYYSTGIFDNLIAAVGHKKTEIKECLNMRGPQGNDKALFTQALERGKIYLAQRFLALGVSPISTDIDGRTPLHTAAYVGRHISAYTGYENIIDDLVRAATAEQINIQDYVNLQNSSTTEYYDEAERFRENNSGKTALHYASERGHSPIVQKLLTLGANPFLVDYQGRNPLHLAALKGFNNIVDDLLEAVTPEKIKDYLNTKDKSGKTALFYAVEGGNEDIVQTFLTLGANPFYIDNQGRTPLHLAVVRYGSDNIVDNLLEVVSPENIKDYLNIKNNKGETAWYCAEFRGRKDTARKFLTLGAEPYAALRAADYF